MFVSSVFKFKQKPYPMKKILLLLLIFPCIAQAQELQGTIQYETVVKLSINVDNEASAQFKHLLPKESKLKNVLHFKGSETIFLPSEESSDHEINEESDNMQFTFRMATPENKIYHDYQSSTKVESREFMGKYFLINGKPNTFKWKLTGKSKQIAGYNCQQAIINDSTNTVAWFTPEISLSAGPGSFGNLPGIILGVESNNGERVTMATSVSLNETSTELIVKPKKGKKVTQQEYDKITEEKMKEMGARRSGSGNSIQILIQEEEY